MRFEEATGATISQLWTTLEPRLQRGTFLEEAAQALAAAVYTQFRESAVLARVYVTVPFGELPPDNRVFVENLVGTAESAPPLQATTPLLSLLGTQGQEAAWDDRRNSQRHKGIPLISSAFVEQIPMIARLLRELGVPLDWIDSHDARRIVTTIGTWAGLFFVEDASQATDDQGRLVIPAQDFVSTYGVNSVFGTGGTYPDGRILVLVVFSRDRITQATAELFLPLADLFRNKTESLIAPATVLASV